MSKAVKTTKPTARSRAPLTPEAQEDKLISLAADLVEQRLRDGTATSQETTTILKLGLRRHRLENELLEQQVKLAKAKTDALEAERHMDELCEQAMRALRSYEGREEEEVDPDDEEY